MKRALYLAFAVLVWSAALGGVSHSGKKAPYVASNYSDRFHRAECKIAGKISADEKLEFEKPEEAVARELVPCKKCNPPVSSIPVSDRKSR